MPNEEWKRVNAEPESNPNQAKIDELDTKLAELIMQKRDLQTNTSFNREDELEAVRNEITSLNRKLAMFDLKKQNDLRNCPKKNNSLPNNMRKRTIFINYAKSSLQPKHHYWKIK